VSAAPANKPDRTKELARLFAEQSRLFDAQAKNSAEIAKALGGAPPAGRAAPKNGSSGRSSAPAPTSGAVATDRALDAPNGNPVVKFNPRRWEGESFNGCTYRDCSSEFLEVLAEALEYSAAHPKEGKENFAAENARCAALAYGWAARKRQSGGGDTGGEPGGPGGGEDPGAGKESW
jgi:ABC-type nitrate/sulfonate/bicarbonate transport system substrate-binding protein